MKRKWVITIIVPIIIGIAYYATYEIAKKSYYDSIHEKINDVAADKFYYALSNSYPFLNQSANAVISRANNIKAIASEVDFDRYVFSILWRKHLNSAESRKESNVLYDLDLFLCSNVYAIIKHAVKQDQETASSIIRFTIASSKLRDIENIIEMASIIHVADQAKENAYKCQDAINFYANNSHDINDWSNFTQ